MKFFLCILLVYINLSVHAQKVEFKPTIKITYNANLNLGEKNKKTKDFILVGNSQDYYFAIDNIYRYDSGNYVSSGGIDTQKNSIIFNERILKVNNKITVFTISVDSKIRYEESEPLQWVLYNGTKMINGVKCQMAATNRFGRRWIAYFSKEYPQSLGPYKFNGLPGLILELYDTRDDYHFTAIKIEKNSEEFQFNLSPFKLMSKKNYLQSKYNMEFTVAAFPDMDEEMRKQTQEMLDKKKKLFINPLELKPLK